MKENESTAQAAQRTYDAAHAMQSGVKFDLELGSDSASPKHLRVGVNSALVYEAAIAALLIEKGVFTQQEYAIACADQMEKEAARYAKLLSEKIGRPVTLG